MTTAFDTVENPICHREGNPSKASETMNVIKTNDTIAAVATCDIISSSRWKTRLIRWRSAECIVGPPVSVSSRQLDTSPYLF